MRMRVEELALQADVSVDTIRYYQKQRLLPAPARDGRVAWYSEEHLERIARVKDLQRRGFTLAVIRRFLAGELDPADERLAMALAAATGADEASAGELLDLDTMAERVGVPAELISPLVEEGMLVPRPTPEGDRFTPGDVAALRAGMELLSAGLPLPELLELARRHHAMTREVAGTAVELFDTYVRKPLRAGDLPDAEKADRLVAAFATLVPAVTSLVAHHFRRILLQIAQEHLEAVGDPAELAAARSEGSWT